MTANPATDGERLMLAAGLRLAALAPEMPEGFVDTLFGRADADDIATLDADTLAALAAAAWKHVAARERGHHDVRILDGDALGIAALSGVTVVEIVNDDMPFLVDSVTAELAERSLEVRLLVHPILAVARRAEGGAALGGAGAERESIIHIHIDRLPGEAARAALAESLERILLDVRRATSDWSAMRARVKAAVAAFRETPPPLSVEEIAEAVQFLEWINADNFTFLGLREYDYVETAEGDRLDARAESHLGILRDTELRVLRRGSQPATLTPEIRQFLQEPLPLIVTKASVKSRVHRRAHMDYIGVKRFGADGALLGEIRIVGLFTSTVYTKPAREIPYLRRKVDLVVRRAGFAPESHSGRALINVLEGYPRDEVFQVDADTLYGFAMEILRLYERPRSRAFVRADPFGRFVSVLVYVPRDRYDSNVRVRIGSYLVRAYEGRLSAFYPGFPEGPLARVHFIIGRDGGQVPQVERATLEAEIAARVQTWGDRLKTVLAEAFEPSRGRALGARYASAFELAYQDTYSADHAVDDIRVLEALSSDRPIGIDFRFPEADDPTRVRLKVVSYGRPLPLSARVPMLERMGFSVIDERSFRVALPAEEGAVRSWIHDMTLERAKGGVIDLATLDARLEATLITTLTGGAESDGYNALTLEAGMAWRDIALLRALGRYLRQARIPFGQEYMAETLVKHPAVAAALVELFHVRFDPARLPDAAAREAEERRVAAEIEAALASVTSLDEDRILRHFLNLVQAAVRTSFFQLGAEGRPKETLAFKFESRRIDGLPAPRPLYEISVYSPRVEGVHLRFGKVARGGLRWSDRPQDFRTEVLGLVKAQQVKNAVIVPVGAKGGFVPKRLPAGPREAVFAEGTEAYKIFVGALLDVTDDIDGGSVVPPANVVRHDADDPYLVVAADKGTATFSDTANGIAESRGFWLGDAFASGGSAGYDHKKMGITARGAWEAVKRHFREMDVDIQTTPFTVAGVGDMSGDVFGNGMLLSKAIRLVAAFDHRDIFIDPDPDVAKSFAERKRLFGLPRSSWADYDAALISAGGGIFSRSAKSVPLSPEARRLIGLDKATPSPQEVMNAILKMPVDLLWFGGIGTYVRAEDESDDQVGDRANDPIRVTGRELRAKVIGEGANLGVTQRGRIEAARRGVRLNTDAIDNSAGVNSSDIEVNIKIALSVPVRDGRLDRAARDALLAEMTDDVAALVLRNNYLQPLALSLAERAGLEELGFEQRLMQVLEGRGLLDRAVEFLPDDAAIGERRTRGEGLTRPELAVLLAYAKLTLHDDVLTSGLPDDPFFAGELTRYFPKALAERFPDAVAGHRLRREIVATALANAVINRGGPAIVVRVADQTGASPAEIAAAHVAAFEAFDLAALYAAVDALDGRIGGATQLDLYGRLQALLISRMLWFVRNEASAGLADVAARHRAGVAEVAAFLQRDEGAGAAERSAAAAALSARGVPEELAARLALLPALAVAPDAVQLAAATGRSVADAAEVLFAVGDHFRLAEIVAATRAIPATDLFERVALDRAVDRMERALRDTAAEVLRESGAGAAGVAQWAESRPATARVRSQVQAIAATGLTLAKATVAADLLGELAG